MKLDLSTLGPQSLPRRTRLSFLLFFAFTVSALVVSSIAASRLLSGIRAYVGGESLWSKAEKDAVLHLIDYTTTHDDADYRKFHSSLSVPLGDRAARLELEKSKPNFDVAFRGFLQGRNSAADIPTMIWLFRSFRHVDRISRAIAIWERGDREVTELDSLAQDLHQAVLTGAPGGASRAELVRQIELRNTRLTVLEDDFSFTLGDTARWLRTILVQVLLVVATLLFVAAIQISRKLGKLFRVERTALRHSEERYRSLFERNLAGVYRTTFEGEILECNDSFLRLFGFSDRAEALATPVWELYDDRGIRDAFLNRLREVPALTNYEVRLRRLDGTSVWVLENASILKEGGGPAVIEGTVIEITDLKHAEAKLTSQAYHDELTGLPNRLLFSDRLGNALARARRQGSRVAVLFLDLDHFKRINESLGHRLADSLLKTIARRLGDAVREQDTISRVGGDEFVLLFQELRTDDAHLRIAENLLARVAQAADVEGHPVYITASIGISVYPSDGDDPDTLVMRADRAMYRAKEHGRNNYQVFAPEMAASATRKVSVEYELREAVKNGEFILHYQPIFDLASEKAVDAEALIRWDHPTKGLIGPKYFVPLAEESTLILPIGSWVLQSACEQASRWQKEDGRRAGVSVNVSAVQFRRGELLETVRLSLESSGLAPEALTLEITEGVAIHDEVSATRILRAVRDLGVRVAIDDFGTGYSSLAYLRRLPITHIKIDQSFLKNILVDSSDREIVGSMIRLAHSLGLRVVAEGVETAEQKELLKELACDECQGYFVGRPASASEFAAFLNSDQRS